MKAYQAKQTNVERALAVVDELLARTWSPLHVRRRVERIVARCNVESHRYVFWRLILALLVAETAAPTPRRQWKAA